MEKEQTSVSRYGVHDQPRWCRSQYVAGLDAPDYWQPKFQLISRSWRMAEIVSVGMGLREAALVFFEGQDDELRSVAENFNLQIISVPGTSGRKIVCRSSSAQRAAQAIIGDSGFDDDMLGFMLGYPPCCRHKFAEDWSRGKDRHSLGMWRDPVIPMMERSEAEGHPAANILLRRIGVRYCPHLPCRSDCWQSTDFGLAMRKAVRRVSVEAMLAMDRLLMAPMEWSSWHGIGEVILPIMRWSFDTDPIADRFVVRRTGGGFLDGGASGGEFPFTEEKSSYRQNGFKTRAGMEAAHRAVEDYALEFFPDLIGNNVLDLGCGDGRLARRLSGFGQAFGVESAVQAARHAQRQCTAVRRARVQDVAAYRELADASQLVLFQPGRLIEEDSKELRFFLMGKDVLLYNYDGKLAEYCDRLGLKMKNTRIGGSADCAVLRSEKS